MVIHPVYSAIQRLNNWGLASKKLFHHYLDQSSDKKDLLKSISDYLIFLFLSYSFGIETIIQFNSLFIRTVSIDYILHII